MYNNILQHVENNEYLSQHPCLACGTLRFNDVTLHEGEIMHILKKNNDYCITCICSPLKKRSTVTTSKIEIPSHYYYEVKK